MIAFEEGRKVYLNTNAFPAGDFVEHGTSYYISRVGLETDLENQGKILTICASCLHCTEHTYVIRYMISRFQEEKIKGLTGERDVLYLFKHPAKHPAFNGEERKVLVISNALYDISGLNRQIAGTNNQVDFFNTEKKVRVTDPNRLFVKMKRGIIK